MQSVARTLPNESSPDRSREVAIAVVRAARAGDADAFATIVRVYYARCLRFAMRFALSHDDAEDCVQDTFVRLHRALPRYEERQRFNAWLFRILANRCRSMRSRARWRLDQISQLDMPSVCWQAENHNVGEMVAQAINTLAPSHREAFLLRHVEGFSYEHIAAITGVTITAARMRVSRACSRLRAEIGV